MQRLEQEFFVVGIENLAKSGGDLTAIEKAFW
jgi:hypothetical protein